MIAVDQWLTQNTHLKTMMIMQVHDELVFEVKTEELERVSSELVEIMQSAASLDVPLLAEAGFGPNWDQAH